MHLIYLQQLQLLNHERKSCTYDLIRKNNSKYFHAQLFSVQKCSTKARFPPLCLPLSQKVIYLAVFLAFYTLIPLNVYSETLH